jgi:hypothetical protein
MVPLNAPFYWSKRIVPPLEFGAMHAILFQMALIPLTMSRYSIATLSGGILDRFVPLNRTLRMHIYLGYTMVIIVFLGTMLFFGFFGFLCSKGQQEFCEKFTSEIMCTGYEDFLAGAWLIIFDCLTHIPNVFQVWNFGFTLDSSNIFSFSRSDSL